MENSCSFLDQIVISDIKPLKGCEASCFTRHDETEQSEVDLDLSKGREDLQRVSTDKLFVSPYNRLKNCTDKSGQANQNHTLCLL